MNILELSWGNPDFLAPYWAHVDLSVPTDLPTNYHMDALPELKRLICELHEKVGNAETKGYHLVVGNGATQILTGLMHVLKKPINAPSPYFLRFPMMANLVHREFKKCPEGYTIITNPNNPDGKITLDKPKKAIYDLCYNWPQYTPTMLKYNEDIMVFSLAKATGHASTRIGWALIKNEALAKKVKDFIEYNTAGVSIEAQTKAINVIRYTLNTTDTCFEEGKKILTRRHQQLTKLKLPFKKLSHNGMFLWLEMGDPETFFCDKLITYVDGEMMGDYFNHARINIGCSEKNFEEFVKRILAK